MRAPTPRTPSAPLRLTAPFGLALLGLLTLVAQPGDVEASGGLVWPRLGARADTDSVDVGPPALDVPAPDSLRLDTLALDSLAAGAALTDTTDSTARARAYFAQPAPTGAAVSLVPRYLPGVRGRLGTYWRREVTLDSTDLRYRVREIVGDDDVRAPADVTLEDFLAARRREALGATFRELSARSADRQTRRNGFGFAVDVPGGDQSAFRTIFGKNEVALTVNGTSNVNLGMRYDQNDLRASSNGDGSTLAPDFGQELNLNVAGTIGDKLTVNVNYDTQSTFDFENQVSLVYEGYEDDIIQRIEAGNVFLQTPATLIRGGQRLFGLRTDLQFGPLALTAVASQQDGQSVDVEIESGANVQAFDLAPFEYEDNQHFFLGYAFHNWWDTAHRVPGVVTLHPEFAELKGIEVWKHEPGLISANTENIETTWAVALADLGEPTPGSPGNLGSLNVLLGGQEYLGSFDPSTGLYSNTQAPLPNPARDQYDDASLNGVRRNGATTNAADLANNPADGSTTLPTGAFSNNKFRRLRENIDYVVDGPLGWITLTSPLSQNEELAVAYQYRTTSGQLVTVGDYLQPAQTDSQTGGRTILKLLRANRPTPTDPLWDITLRNIYRIGGRSLTPSSFDLEITFEPAGASASTDPRDISFGQRTFLEVLGLDRINTQGQATPDNRFDFTQGFTVDPANGRVVFPVRRPFGDYLENLIRYGWTVSGQKINVSYGGDLPTAEAAVARYVPKRVNPDEPTAAPAGLYDLVQNQAQRTLPSLTRFQIEGEFKSASQSTFNVGFQLVPGTVRVTANGIDLVEDTDYRVNYTAGTVDIIQPRYLADGQRIRVSVEQNQIFQIGSKTLLGLRGDYRISEDARLGATWMRLAERPLDDKPAIGREAFDNTVVGLDGSYLAEPRWLTRAIDALPLVQTRAPSRVEFRGEVARLNPGHPQTTAFDRARDALTDAGYDFDQDEFRGVSYIDDFEQSENSYTTLEVAGGWRIAAPPDSAGPFSVTGDANSDVTDPTLQGNWRGLFTWYSMTETAYRAFANLLTPATRKVIPEELYGKEYALQLEQNQRLQPLGLLDLYFDPTRRGPYNYNRELSGTFAQSPEDVWGGFIRSIDGSYSDFDGQNNVEFIEVLFAPLGGRSGTEAVGPDARLYIDLGRLNEDILPNSGFTNSEDGLRDGPVLNPDTETDSWGRLPDSQTNGVIDLFKETGRNEDLGLDGLPSTTGLIDTDADAAAPYATSEIEFFSPFVNSLTPGTPEFARSADAGDGYADPSADDYHYYLDESDYFNDSPRFPGGASVQERYAHYYPAFELNSITARQSVGLSNGIATTPNSEDINGNSRADVTEQYHRYEVPLTDAGLRASPFFQNTLTTPSGIVGTDQTWYLLRIPVRTDRRTTTGLAPDDFSRIEAIRLWTTGHDKPATIRIASFELVGSQWLKSDEVGFVDEGRGDDLTAEIPSLFIESLNNEENASIYAVPRGTIQKLNRTSYSGPARATREQAIVFRAEGLGEGRRTAIARTYATRPLDLTKYENLRMDVHGDGFERDDNLRVFLRVGDNETDDYYEIEQPVYPFDPDRLDGLGLTSTTCPPDQPSNCARADSLWQTNVRIGGGDPVDLNPIFVPLSSFNQAKLERDRQGIDPVTPYTLDETPEGAAPGARVTVRGQPSIQDIRTIVLGVRNAEGGQTVALDTVTMWFNELRVTGYDEGGGASGFLTANIALADLASVNARLSFTDDGFGELGGALGAREFASNTSFTLTSSFSAHRLLPERFGWNIPVSVSVTENTSTPRYDPDNGDIRLDELVATATAAVEAGDEVPEPLRAEAVLERAQTTASSRNVRVAVSKGGSRSPWLRYTLDGLSASYTASTQDGSNPRTQLTASDSWSGNLSYRVTVPRPLTIAPLWFARPVPLLGALGGLRFNVLPQSLTLSADARRSISATQQRLAAEYLNEPDTVRAFRAPVRRTQLFDHGRQMDLRYNPLAFLQLSYASNTDQDLGAAGQREGFRTLVRDSTGAFSRTFPLAPADARDDPAVRDALAQAGLIDTAGAVVRGVEFLGGSELEVLPFGEALGGIFGGDVRTRAYSQRLTAALRVSTRRVKWLSWIQPQAVSYSTDYSWNDQPIPTADTLEVASAGTRTAFQTGIKLVPRDFWRLFPFYRSLEGSTGPRTPRAASDTTGGGFRFNPLRLARGAFLAVTGIDDVTLRYEGSLTAAAGGLEGQAYSLLSGINGAAPPIGYRLGLDRELDIDRRIANPDALSSFTDVLGEQHNLDARTTFQPLRGLNVGLNWRTTWGLAEKVTYRLDASNALEPGLPNRGGNGTSTVFSFGGSYDNVLERHADRFRDDVANAPTDQPVATEFASPTGLSADFREEFARGLGAFGPNGLFQIPMPNWTVTYSGLERLPLIRYLTQQITLQHGYSSTSQTDYATSLFSGTGTRTVQVGGAAYELLSAAALAGDLGYDEPTSLLVNERFQPLIGLNVGWKGGLQTTVSLDRSNTYSLQAASAQYREKEIHSIRVDLSYAKTGLRLLGLRRLNNNLRLTLTGALNDDITTSRTLQQDILALLDGQDIRPANEVLTTRFQLSPRVSYTISNQVTADVFLRYERIYSEGTQGAPSKSFDGGVNLRILFSN